MMPLIMKTTTTVTTTTTTTTQIDVLKQHKRMSAIKHKDKARTCEIAKTKTLEMQDSRVQRDKSGKIIIPNPGFNPLYRFRGDPYCLKTSPIEEESLEDEESESQSMSNTYVFLSVDIPNALKSLSMPVSNHNAINKFYTDY